MKSTEMLNQIKTLLNIEVKLEDMKLENGTIVTAESFESGKEIFIVTDEDKIAMPVGEYILEDGRLVVVKEEGLIDEVRDVSDEVPAEEEVTEETEDLEKETKAAVAVDCEEMEKRIQNLEDAIADLKRDKESKEEMGDETSVLKSRTVKEEFAEVELSEAAAKPIKHNPEGEVKQKKRVEFAKGRFNSTMDRVLNKLNR